MARSAERQSRAGTQVRLQVALVRPTGGACWEPARDRRAGRAHRDYNVMPTDLDVYAPERWVDDALFRTEVRDAYSCLLEQGWTDALRAGTRANGSTPSGGISGMPSAGTPVCASIICSSVRDWRNVSFQPA